MESSSEREEVAPAIAAHTQMHTAAGVLWEVLKERTRQVEKGWTPEHDDNTHVGGAIIRAAISKLYGALNQKGKAAELWPWFGKDYSAKAFTAPPRELLIESIALLVAEVERRDRTIDGLRNGANRPPTTSSTAEGP